VPPGAEVGAADADNIVAFQGEHGSSETARRKCSIAISTLAPYSADRNFLI
jgi:hypothetical protein